MALAPRLAVRVVAAVRADAARCGMPCPTFARRAGSVPHLGAARAAVNPAGMPMLARKARAPVPAALRRSLASWSAGATCLAAGAGTAGCAGAGEGSGAAARGAVGIRPAQNQTPWLRRSMSGGGGSGGGGTWAKAEAAIAHERVVLFSKTTCGYCGRVRRVLERLGLKAADITEFQLDTVPDGANVQTELHGITGIYTVPNLFISGVCFGGSEDVLDAYDSGTLQEALRDAGFDVHEAT